jgi:dTDP-4-amino-4,6-dideoxygalactose transaminase
VALARKMNESLTGIPGIEVPWVARGNTHVYWKYCLRVDARVIEGGSPGLGAALAKRGIACAPRYIQKPAFRCQVFRDQRTFGNSRWPFTLARPEAVDYSDARFPGTLQGLEGILVLPWNEKYEHEHVEYIASSIRECVDALKGGSR